MKRVVIRECGEFEIPCQYILDLKKTTLTKRLNYTYLGTVIKGGSAGTYMMPEKMNKKLFKQLRMLGESFEINGSFNIEVIKELAKPNELSKGKSRLWQFLNRLGIGDNIFWNMMLKNNKALDRKCDKPFAHKLSD